MIVLTLTGVVISLALSLVLFYFRLWPLAVLPLGALVAWVYRFSRTQQLERSLIAAILGLAILLAGAAWVTATPPRPLYLHIAGVAVSPDRVYLSDLAGQRIVVLDSDYQVVGEWMRGNGNPAGLTVDAEGRVIAAYPENQYYVRIRDGVPQAYPEPGGLGEALGQFRLPVDVAADKEQRIYVVDADNDRVDVYAADGKTYQTSLPNPPTTPLRGPRGVAVSPVDQTVYVADTYNNRVAVYTPVTNAFQFKLSLPLKNEDPRDDLLGPEDVAIRSNGDIVIADTGHKRIVVLNRDGQFVNDFMPCEVCRPSQVALGVDDTSILSVDATQNILRVRKLNGEFVSDLGAQPDLPPSLNERRWTGFSIAAAMTLMLLAAVYLAWVLAGATMAQWLNLDRRIGIQRGLYSVAAVIWPKRFSLGIQRILDGKLVSEGVLRQPGPGWVSIDGASAVVFERKGQISRVSGPGRMLTEPGEVIRAIFDLRVQTRKVDQTQEAVYSRDAIPLEMKFTLQYRIIQDEATLVTKGRYEVKPEDLRRAALNAKDWHEQTEQAAREVLREVITTRRVEEIFDPRATKIGFISPRAPLQHEMRRRLMQLTPRWGVEVVSVTLDEIRLPEKVRERLLQVWDVEWNHLVEVGRVQTEVWALQERKQFERAEEKRQLEAQLEQAQLRLTDMRNKALAEWEVERLNVDQEKDVAPERAQLEAQLARLKARAEAEVRRVGLEAEMEAERWRLAHDLSQQPDQAQLDRLKLLAGLEAERKRLMHDQGVQPERAQLAVQLESIKRLAEFDIESAKTERELEAVLKQAMLRIAALRAGGELERWQLENVRARELEVAEIAVEVKRIEEDGKRTTAFIQAEAEVRRAEGHAQAKALLGRGEALGRVEYLRQLLNTLRDDERLLKDNPAIRDLVTRLAAFSDIDDIAALANFLAHESSERPPKPKPQPPKDGTETGAVTEADSAP